MFNSLFFNGHDTANEINIQFNSNNTINNEIDTTNDVQVYTINDAVSKIKQFFKNNEVNKYF